MQISKRTLNIMKYASMINENLYLKKNDNKVKTISSLRNVLATYEMDQTFAQDIKLYDTAEFLKFYKSLENPIIDKIDATHIFIKTSSGYDCSWRMHTSDDNFVYPTKVVPIPKSKPVAIFEFGKDDCKDLFNLVQRQFQSNFVFAGDGKKTLTVCDYMDQQGNKPFWGYGNFVKQIEVPKIGNFTSKWDSTNFTSIMPDDYTVSIWEVDVTHVPTYKAKTIRVEKDKVREKTFLLRLVSKTNEIFIASLSIQK